MNIPLKSRILVSAVAFVPIAADAQSVGATAANAAGSVPAWVWWIIAAVAVIVVVAAAVLSRRRKRTTIIKTRLG